MIGFSFNTIFSTDECLSNPCFNGATCLEYDEAYHCICMPGFDGYDCENGKNKISSFQFVYDVLRYRQLCCTLFCRAFIPLISEQPGCI